MSELRQKMIKILTFDFEFQMRMDSSIIILFINQRYAEKFHNTFSIVDFLRNHQTSFP